MKKIACIIQARSNSKRLPNKILKKISGRTVIEILISRLKKSKKIDKIIVATTKKKNDDLIIKIAQKNKVDYYRGNESNVLKRYYDCANKFNLDNILRITSDCPLSDKNLIDKMIGIYFTSKVDYMSNTIKRTFPDGLDIEIFNFRALNQAYKYAKSKFEKEHVTQYFFKDKNIKKINYKNDIDLSKKRWTLDYYNDFLFISSVFNYFKPDIHMSYKKILRHENRIKKIFR
jgi:spore coat polysaccharide biosynthesis protein SpsF (cytidylyltransferase family)